MTHSHILIQTTYLIDMTEETRKLLELIEQDGGPMPIQKCVELPVFVKNTNANKMIRSKIQKLYQDGLLTRVKRGVYAAMSV